MLSIGDISICREGGKGGTQNRHLDPERDVKDAPEQSTIQLKLETRNTSTKKRSFEDWPVLEVTVRHAVGAK